eukprot:1151759-Pelagomonas_calceolata.AAC.5
MGKNRSPELNLENGERNGGCLVGDWGVFWGPSAPFLAQGITFYELAIQSSPTVRQQFEFCNSSKLANSSTLVLLLVSSRIVCANSGKPWSGQTQHPSPAPA